MGQITTEQYIAKAKLYHGNKYDYSKTIYTGSESPVTITCAKHGDFIKRARYHTDKSNPQGCPYCSGFKLNRDLFIAKALDIHNSKYNYDKVIYKNSLTKIEIGCPTHGYFFQTPGNHLFGYGCEKCSQDSQRSTTIDFVDRSIKIHNNKYSYENVIYVDTMTKVEIRCPKHGIFKQTPFTHLRGVGCMRCAAQKPKLKSRSTTEKFIKAARSIHGNKYDYTKTQYERAVKKVEIVCPQHGSYYQTPNTHLRGGDCPICGGRHPIDLETFLNRAVGLYGDRFDYSKINYTNFQTPIEIICKEHGAFSQRPCNHLQNKGCPRCARINNVNNYKRDNWETKQNGRTANLYLIECISENEKFIKIGITFDLQRRFTYIPYKVKIVHHLEAKECSTIWKLEKQFKFNFKPNRYKPDKDFGGKYECFNVEELETYKNFLRLHTT